MNILDDVGAVVDIVKPWLFPLSVVFFFAVYPLGLFISVLLDGRAATKASRLAAAQHEQKPITSVKALREPISKTPASRRPKETSCCFVVKVAIVFAVCMSLGLIGSAASFVLGVPKLSDSNTRADAGVVYSDSQSSSAVERVDYDQPYVGSLHSLSITGMTTCAVFAGLIAALRSTRGAHLVSKRSKQASASSRGNKVFRRGSGYDIVCPDVDTYDFPPGVRVFRAPKTSPVGSLWHNVDLRVKNWLDQETGLYHYINEIPFGALQKFEMHTKQAENVIIEHQSGSKKLQAFGVPVPFNYGCFPQTFRDPLKTDEISGVGGDDDPLDVIDLTGAFVDPGAVVRCRPLGAVCLIDEGQADWKILVVNVDVESPLSVAHSVADVDRLAPGRIDEALKWMDDFKQHSTVGSRLHFEVHDADRAVSIIEGDNVSYHDLLKEVASTGYARSHWIGSFPPRMEVSTLRWPLEHHLASSPAMMGTTRPETILQERVPHRMLAMRRKASPQHSSSEDSDASSLASNGTSSEQELA